MRRIFPVVSVLSLCLFLIALPAYAGKKEAKAPHDMVGVWKGTTQSVAVGKLGHTTPSASPKFLQKDFTITIEKQEGPTFYGTKASDKAKETLLGLVDRSKVYMVDDDGILIGKLLSKNKMAVRYLEVTKDSKVASLTIYVREKKGDD